MTDNVHIDVWDLLRIIMDGRHWCDHIFGSLACCDICIISPTNITASSTGENTVVLRLKEWDKQSAKLLLFYERHKNDEEEVLEDDLEAVVAAASAAEAGLTEGVEEAVGRHRRGVVWEA
jgi:hypothetical protein